MCCFSFHLAGLDSKKPMICFISDFGVTVIRLANKVKINLYEWF